MLEFEEPPDDGECERQARYEPRSDPWQKVPALLELLGLHDLGGLTLTVKPTGESMEMEIVVELGQGVERGLFGAFFPAGGLGQALLELVPVHRKGWKVDAWRLDRLYETAYRVVDLFSEEIGSRPGELETAFKDFFRVRLKEDLIDQFAGPVIVLESKASRRLDPDDEGFEGSLGFLLGSLPLPFHCLGFALRDPDAFGRSFETLIRSRGLHVTRKTETYREVPVQRLSFFNFSFHYALSGRLFLVGLGEQGARDIRALLDEKWDRGQGKPRAALPEGVARRIAMIPTKRNDLQVFSIARQIEFFQEPFGFGLGGGELWFGDPLTSRGPSASVLEPLTELLKNHGLEQAVWASLVEGSQIRFIYFW